MCLNSVLMTITELHAVCNSADRLNAIFTYKHEVANRADTQTTIILSQILAQDTVYLYL